MPQRKINIFISYKHDPDDERILQELLMYMRGSVENAGGQFWVDQEVQIGDDWDKEIKQHLAAAHIAIVLVSQAYLWSPYITNIEIKSFIKQRQQNGLVIMPIILSPCLWDEHEWLKRTQYCPKNGETIEEHYTDNGKRKRLYAQITIALKNKVLELRKSLNAAPAATAISVETVVAEAWGKLPAVAVGYAEEGDAQIGQAAPHLAGDADETAWRAMHGKLLIAALGGGDFIAPLLAQHPLGSAVIRLSFESDVALVTRLEQEALPALALFPADHQFSDVALEGLRRVSHRTLVFLIDSVSASSIHLLGKMQHLLEIELTRTGGTRSNTVITVYAHDLMPQAPKAQQVAALIEQFVAGLNLLYDST